MMLLNPSHSKHLRLKDSVKYCPLVETLNEIFINKI